MSYNMIFFALLSILTSYVCLALLKDSSAFNVALFYQFIKFSPLITIPFILLILSVLFSPKYSAFLHSLASLSTVFFILAYLYADFNKAVLLIVFLYSIIAYFLGQGWRQTLDLACYCPNISHRDINDCLLMKIPIEFKVKKSSPIKGILRNWDENSCFIKFESTVPLKKLQDALTVRLEYNGKTFENQGEVVSHVPGTGVGIIFHADREKRFNWQDFYTIMSEMALTPEYLVQ